MNPDLCSVHTNPVVVVATHEELLRSARDMWAVTVSLLTELTPDKFATAPWAAALFTAELPFILAKLWHIQHALITSANSYMQTESMITTFIETIDIPKLLKELAPWVVNLKGAIDLPIGISQQVPPVEILQPNDVNIIKQRFAETNCTNEPLIRHEQYNLISGRSQHWFYLPKTQQWEIIDGKVATDSLDPRLTDYIKQKLDASDQIVFVAEQDGELIIPDVISEDVYGTVEILKLD